MISRASEDTSSPVPYCRPNWRTETRAAFSRLSPPEQIIQESSQLAICRDILERTLLILCPQSPLALKLQGCLDEIRRRLLTMLVEENPCDHHGLKGPRLYVAHIDDRCGYGCVNDVYQSSTALPCTMLDGGMPISKPGVEIGNKEHATTLSPTLGDLPYACKDEYSGNGIPVSLPRGKKRSPCSSADASPVAKRQKVSAS